PPVPPDVPAVVPPDDPPVPPDVPAVVLPDEPPVPVPPVLPPPGAVMFVVMLALHRTVLPGLFPERLHWSMVTGSAGLMLDPDGTWQSMVPPPPFAEPLH
ncbi:MAG: hypothetical protein H0V92_10305, partial [Pseudonocardiales bacterium]|nr:hypothetical protein [Pseudonocardiales bacterium]